MSSEPGLEARGVTAVLRFQVDEEGPTDFKREAERLINLARTHHPESLKHASVRLLQPVVGSEPFEWELRVELPNMEALGRLLDQWSSNEQAIGLSRTGSILGDLMSIQGAKVVKDGIPVYRVWG
jgi:hypothetical protein